MWKKFKQLFYALQRDVPEKIIFPATTKSLHQQKFELRQARMSDLADLIRLEGRVYKGYYPWSQVTFATELNNSDSLYLVLGLPIELVALAGIRYQGAGSHVTILAVDPAWQKQGIGTYLMTVLIKLAQTWHCQQLSLEVRIDNHVARQLYESLGFQVMAVQPNYYQDVHQDGLKMVLQLK